MDGPQLGMKSFEIKKRLVYEAWMKVQANGGAPGVDSVSIDRFADKETDNLYKLWNRMSSGSYFPGPVRAVEIPKDHGTGVRVLGVPNTVGRIAQTAAAMLLEEELEPIFHRDSYGYRPGRSAHDALAVTRQRCWKKDWVLDIDVRAFFDSVPHDLLLKAVAHHTDERWVLLYIERWLTRPHADARRDSGGTGEGNPARVPDLAAARQPLHALRVRQATPKREENGTRHSQEIANCLPGSTNANDRQKHHAGTGSV
jgi:RNA-directed DNA polymerase